MSRTAIATSSTPHLRWPRHYAQARITQNGRKGAVAVHSPFHGCDVYITPRENMLLMWLGRGKRTTLRGIPTVLGYTTSGFRKAIATLRKLGLMGFLSRRGCTGYTRLWSNVSPPSSGGRSFVSRLLLPKAQGAHIRPEPSLEQPRLGRLEYRDGSWVAV